MKKDKPVRFWRRAVTLAVIFLTSWFAANRLGAQTWNGGGANDNWSTGANWNLGAAPVNNGTAAIVFDGTVRLTPNVNAAWSINGLNFNNTAGAFTIGGSQLTIQGGGITNFSANAQTINTALVLGAAQTWNANAGDLILGGAINKNGNALTFDGGFNTTASGVISSSAALTKNGTGTLTFSGASANTFSGSVTVNAGTLILNKTAGLNAISGGGGTLTIGDGTGGANADVVRLNADNQIIDTKAVTIASSGLLNLNGHSETIGSGATTTINGGNITTGGGTLTVISTLNFTGGGTIDTGGGTLILDSAGGNTVNGNTSGSTAGITGKISLGGVAQTFAIDANVTLDMPAIVSNGSIIKNNPGTLILSGANSYAGGTTLNSGIISVGNDQALGTGTLDLSAGTIQASGAARTLANPITISANSTIGGSLDLTFTGNGTMTGNRTLTVNNTGQTTFSGAIGENASLLKLTKSGAGTLILSGPNTFSGGVTLNTGTLGAGNNQAAGTGTLDLSGGTIQASGAARTLANAVTISASSGISGSQDLTFSGNATLTVSPTLTVDNTGLTTFSGAIGINSGTRNLTKAGAGTLILSGSSANTYNGTTTISAGALNIQKNGALGTTANGTTAANGAALELQNDITVTGEGLTLNGSGISSGGALRNVSGNNTWTGAITLGSAATIASAAGTLTIGAGGIANSTFLTTFDGAGNTTVSGVIGSGSGGVTKNGTGTVALSGANTYTGATTVNAGVLNIQHNGALGTTANGTTVASGAALELQNSITVANEGLTLNGSGISSGGALRSVSGNNVWTGNLTLGSASTIASDAVGQTLTLSGNIANGANTLTVSGSGDTTISGVIGNGTGGLTKAGTGTLILSSPTGNTFTGATTVNGGTLSITQAGALGATSAVNLIGGTLTLSGSGNRVNDSAGIVFNGGTLNAPSLTETFGQLNLAANSSLTLGSGGGGRLTFASATRTGGALVVNQWSGTAGTSGTGDQIFIVVDPGAALLASINFTGFSPGATRLTSGEIAPVPEPYESALITGLCALGFATYRRIKRRQTARSPQEITG